MDHAQHAQINLIVGPNGSGKSRLLIALQAENPDGLYLESPDATIGAGPDLYTWAKRLLAKSVPVFLVTYRQDTIDAFLDDRPDRVRVYRCRFPGSVEILTGQGAVYLRDEVGIDLRL